MGSMLWYSNVAGTFPFNCHVWLPKDRWVESDKASWEPCAHFKLHSSGNYVDLPVELYRVSMGTLGGFQTFAPDDSSWLCLSNKNQFGIPIHCLGANKNLELSQIWEPEKNRGLSTVSPRKTCHQLEVNPSVPFLRACIPTLHGVGSCA